MRLWKSLAKWVTCSGMLFLSGACAFASIGCADEVLECCKCNYSTCSDPMTGMPLTVCSCEQYTYEECGLYCKEDLPKQLEAQGIPGCGTPSSTLAVDAC